MGNLHPISDKCSAEEENERSLSRFKRNIRLSQGQLRKGFLSVNHKETETQRGKSAKYEIYWERIILLNWQCSGARGSLLDSQGARRSDAPHRLRQPTTVFFAPLRRSRSKAGWKPALRYSISIPYRNC
jgi:hypothetical protein